jgi:hypothetical protein
MRNVYVWTALWTLDTFIPRSGSNASYALNDLTTIERYQLLARVVEQAWMSMARNLIENAVEKLIEENAIWLFLFVAPEYYFARSDSAHAISETEKRAVVSRLSTLSGQYTNLILVPGSIAWKKPVMRPTAELRKKDPSSRLRTAELKLKSRLEKFEAQAKKSMINEVMLIDHAIDREIKEILADPHMKLSEKKRVAASDYRSERRFALTKQAQDKLLAATKKMKENAESDLTRCFLARNTAYAFYAGREVARYHKRTNFYEVRADESDGGYVIFDPGGGPDGAGDLFEVDGVTFGMEICFDHSLGYLSQLTAKRPQVQIVISAAVKLIDEHVFVAKDCFVVHASSQSDDTLAYCNTGKAIEKLAMLDDPAERGTLRYAILPFQVEEKELLTLEDFIVNK